LSGVSFCGYKRKRKNNLFSNEKESIKMDKRKLREQILFGRRELLKV